MLASYNGDVTSVVNRTHHNGQDIPRCFMGGVLVHGTILGAPVMHRPVIISIFYSLTSNLASKKVASTAAMTHL